MRFRRQPLLRTLSRQFWGFIVCTIIALAVLVQIGRMSFPLVNDYRYVIEEALGEQLGVVIEIGELNAEWQGLRPRIVLDKLNVRSQDGTKKVFTVEKALAELSLIDSLIQRGFAWRTITFEDFETTLVQKPNFSWSLQGYDGGTANSENPFIFDDPLDIFLFGRRVEIKSASLSFKFNSGKRTELLVPLISLENDRFFHRMRAELGAEDSKLLEFVVEGYGDPRDKANFSASGYLGLNQVPIEDVLGAVLKELPDKKLFDSAEDARLDLQLWFRGNPSIGLLTQGRIEVSDFPQFAQHNLNLPTSLSSDLGGAWKEGSGGYINFQDLKVDWGENTFPIQQFSIYSENKTWGFRLPELDVVELIEIFNDANPDADDEIGEFVKGLDPKGQIKHLDLRLVSREEGWFKAKAYVEQAGISAHKGIPEIRNASAFIETSLNSGFANVKAGEGLALFIPKSFDETFVVDNARGQLRWGLDLKKQILRLNSSVFRGEFEGAPVNGAFALIQGLKSGVTEPILALQVNARGLQADHFWRYMPKNSPEQLIDWLDSSELEGEVEKVSILYNGSVAKESKFQPIYQVAAEVSDASLKFEPSWPRMENISGSVFLNSDKFESSISQASLFGNRLEGISISTESSARNSDLSLNISANALGETEQARKLVLSSSLKDSFSSFLPNWKFSGNYQAQLNLNIPLEGEGNEIRHSLDVQVQDNDLWVGELELNVEELNGRFNSSTGNLFNSGEMTASLWDRPVVISAGSANPVDDIHIQFSGDLNMAALKQWAERPELAFFENDSRFSGSATIPTSNESEHEAVLVSIRSSLNSTVIDLPEPFGKNSDKVGDFQLDINVYDELIRYAYRHNNVLNSEIIVKDEELPAISINFGRSDIERLPAMEYGKVNAAGQLAVADYDKWIAVIDRYVEDGERIEKLNTNNNDEIEDDVISHLELYVEQFSMGELLFDDVNFVIDSELEQWKIAAKSDTFSGDIYIPVEDKPTRIDLHYLSILEDDVNTDVEESDIELSALSDIDLSEIGPTQVSIKQLKIENSDWGSWTFDVAPIENGLHFFNLRSNVKGLRIGEERSSDFFWTKIGDQHVSRFVGPISVDDTLDALRAWELEEIVTSESGYFNADIRWHAEPDMISLANIIGSVDFNLQSGSFLQADEAGENPVLRLMALLNFDTFARRLRFDFSDLAAKGFHYDSVLSEIAFHGGTAEMIRPLEVKSSSSKMNMTGTLDLVNETVDGDLAVTLPVGGNLAFATAFAAGLPAAVGVYVVSKMFNKQVDKATSINYRITGDWEDPKLKVKRSKKSK